MGGADFVSGAVPANRRLVSVRSNRTPFHFYSYTDLGCAPSVQRLPEHEMKPEGICVVDLSRFPLGPWVVMATADHGAEIVKIESHASEPTRHLGSTIHGFSAYFRNTRRGKQSLVLGLKTTEGKEIFRKLAAESDVVIDSFRPRVMNEIGLDYDALRALNPCIAYVSISVFGQAKPMALRPSHDVGTEALAGVLSLRTSGEPELLELRVLEHVTAGNQSHRCEVSC